MIIFGWEVKPITQIELALPEFDSKCEKHGLTHRVIIGKRYNTLYFIPINYFWAPTRVFKVCDECSSDYHEVPRKSEKIILDYYHKKISSKDLHNLMSIQIEEYKKSAEQNEKQDEENFGDFIKLIPYIIGFIILIAILKVLFF